MRPIVPVLAALLAGACAPAVAGTVAAPAPAAAQDPSLAADPLILAGEGGALRPIQNGGRVAIASGWATIAFSPLPLERSDLDLDITLVDADGRPLDAAVEVTYEMVDMHHGEYTQRATVHQGRHRMPVRLVMPGAWRFTVRIDRGGAVSTLVVVAREIG